MTDKVRKRKKKRKNKQRRIFERSLRFHVMLGCVIVSVIVCSAVTFAWYGSVERVADSEAADIMKPYYLTLRNPSDTATLELAVGNLFPGDAKKIVFCVSNKNNEKTGLDMGVTSFEYAIELIHTQNLALDYKVYELEKLEGERPGAITVLDIVDQNGTPTEYRSYFDLTTSVPLSGEDVSEVRRVQAGLQPTMPVNAGEYISFTKSTTVDTQGNLKKLRLEANEVDGKPTFDSQYFLLEIDWEDGAAQEFEKYEKETDMIYLLVEALQPEPQKKETP